MEFLFLFTLVYLIPSFVFMDPTKSWERNPLICEWKHKNGKSGYECLNGQFTNDEGTLWSSIAGTAYTMVKKVEPDYVTFNGWPIDIKDIIRKFYDDINQNRLIHRVTILKNDSSLALQAQQRANQLAEQNFKDSRSWHDGESNVYVTKNDIYKMVSKWYNQRSKYNYDDPENNNVRETGDFSQMVWSGSERIGCGVSNNGPDYYGVCIYNPPGNVPGEYQKNVKKDYATVDLRFGRR